MKEEEEEERERENSGCHSNTEIDYLKLIVSRYLAFPGQTKTIEAHKIFQ